VYWLSIRHHHYWHEQVHRTHPFLTNLNSSGNRRKTSGICSCWLEILFAVERIGRWYHHVQRCKRVVVVSNDTDTFALLLHYTPYFQDLWSEEIWQQNGTGEKRRKLPLHQAVSKLGASLVKAVIKVHILIGDDCMGKLGSKHAAVACDPVQ